METAEKNINSEREIMLRKVFSVISHDLKTPLACIIGSLEIIERMNETISDNDRNALISTAISEARRLDGFITEMLETAKH